MLGRSVVSRQIRPSTDVSTTALAWRRYASAWNPTATKPPDHAATSYSALVPFGSPVESASRQVSPSRYQIIAPDRSWMVPSAPLDPENRPTATVPAGPVALATARETPSSGSSLVVVSSAKSPHTIPAGQVVSATGAVVVSVGAAVVVLVLAVVVSSPSSKHPVVITVSAASSAVQERAPRRRIIEPSCHAGADADRQRHGRVNPSPVASGGPMALRTFLDGTLFAERQTTSDGRPLVVALHGWRRDRHDLAPVVAGREALLFDLPGHGASPPPSTVWGSSEYAAAVARALDSLALDRPVTVLGHSFGGRVGVHLAAERPDLVGGLVLAGVPLLRTSPAFTPPIHYRVVRWAHRRKLVPDSAMERMRQRGGSEDYKAASGIMRDVFVKLVNETYEDQLRATKCPVAFVWGSRDAQAPVGIAEQARGMVATLAAYDVVDAGHDVHRDRPDAVVASIDAVESRAVMVVVFVVGLGALGVAGMRWLRVAQREHYIPGSCLVTVQRWLRITWWNAVLWVIALALVVGGAIWQASIEATLGAVAAAAVPVGMTVLGHEVQAEVHPPGDDAHRRVRGTRRDPLRGARRDRALAVRAGASPPSSLRSWSTSRC